ncbi:Fanconi anemia group I protein-like protein [Acromyrmex echinatior]|uniref:Fanconi anemia group I protein-like protein n=1 Tax=Acromyrmex echinatior TaxID=103372 RepID=F4WTE2_ACREC|nr:Fanconi anemia group I protein-like protein [Acromyrmex echinatior]
MSEKLNSLITQKDQAQLQKFVWESSTEELTKITSNEICNADISKILDEVLQVCSESENLFAKRVKLVESALKALGKAKVTINHANEIVNRIVLDFPKYPKLHLIKLVDFCLASIRNNDDEFRSWKDLLPVLLEVLEEEKYITYMNGEVTGSKYKDISLEKEDHAMVITVFCTKLQDIPLDEVPPFVHQSLRLCTNQDNKYLLEALRKYFTLRFSQTESTDTFESIDIVNPKEVRDVESTVLYHISQSAELNHQHIRDYIKYFKSISHIPEAVLEPFMLSVLLTVASIDENQILEMLRAIINKRNENDIKQKHSAWLRKLIPDSYSVMNVIGNVIEASNRDRHLVLKGLVDLAFVLMTVENKTKTNVHPLWQIGIKILQKIMRKHHETVATIFQMLIDKIVASRSSISQYTDCLAYMCHKLTVLVLDHQESIIMLFDQISSIPGEIAIFIVSAIFPLVQVSVSIREHLILTLRQALYRKGTFNRQMAVSGILEMLRNLKIHSMSGLAMSSSQYANSSSTGTSSTSILTQVTLERGTQARGLTSRYNRTLCYDILGILRRCFTHECEVRLHLYNGLYEAILKNIEIAEYVLEMLLPHFKTFFETDENVVVPVKLDLCIAVQGDQVILQEPLAELILVLQKIYIKSALIKSSFVDELAIILESLCRRMPRLETEHLSLDDKLDLSNTSIKAQEKLQFVLLTIKIYEALISFRIGAWSVNCTDTAQNIKNLFKGYTRLVEFTKHIPKVKKGEGKNKRTQNDPNTSIKKAGRSSSIKLPPSIIDLFIVHKSLSLFYLKSVPWASEDQVTVLIDNHDFYHYILRTLLQILQNIKLLMEYNLRKHKEQYMKTYFEIGKLLYNHVILDLNKVLDTDEQGTILALECFKELCCLICTYFSSELSQFLNIIIPKSTQAENLNSQLENIIAAVQMSFRTFFTEEEKHEENSKQILGILLDIIYQLTQQINFCQINADEVFESMMKFTQLEDMNPQASLTIFQILLLIEEPHKEYGELLIDISLALCEKIGTVDKTEISENNKFKIIHEETADKLYNLINNSVKEKLDNVSWLLVRLKAEQNIVCPPGTDLEEYQEKVRTQERSLCRQLSHIIQILYTIANVAVKPGLSTDIMFKNLQVVYNLLSNLTKYFYGKSSKQNAAFQSVKFIQVIQSAGKPLKSGFYNLITYIEGNQNAKTSKADSHLQRNKILKETRIIPRVICEIEQFHKEILSLDKKTGVPLEIYIKHSITRDFRIKSTQLAEALDKLNISMLNTQTSRRNNDTSNADINDVTIESPTVTPSSKRSRQNDTSSKSPEFLLSKRSRRSSES